MSKKVCTTHEGGEEEEPKNPMLDFQERVLSCLGDLQNNLINQQKASEGMVNSIKRLRIEIHGEDIDE